MAKIQFRNDSAGTIYLDSFGHQQILVSEVIELFDQETKLKGDSQITTLLNAGDLVLIDDTGTDRTAAEALKILGGTVDLVRYGGASYDLLCTDPSGDIIWSAGSVLVKEEGTLVNSIPFTTLNFVGSAITATDATGRQTDITIVALQNIVEDTTPQLGGMLDVNGNAIGDGINELITFIEDPSAVNQIEIENQATGGGPIIRAAGDDTNIDLKISSKGTGVVNITGDVTVSGTVDGKDVSILIANVVEDTTPQLGGMLDVNGFDIGNGTEELIKFVETGSAVNEITITNAATANGPIISSTGADTNIDLVLTPKGTGVIDASTSVISNVVDPVAAQDVATKNYVDSVSSGPTGLTNFHDVFRFYEQGSTGDIYLMRADSLASNKFVGAVALANGRVVHVTSAREKDAHKFSDIVVRKQTASGTTWASGTWTDVGTALLMNNTILSDTYTNLTGYTFNAGDAIAVYLDKSTPVGGSSCEDPFVALYIKYD